MTSVSVRIPTILRSYTGGIAEVIASPGALREVIAGVDASYPGIAGRILDGYPGGRRRLATFGSAANPQRR